jgi:serine protease Do
MVSSHLAAAVLAADQPLAELEEQAIKAAVERVAPSVVRIETVGGLERAGEMLVGTGPTTGLVVDAEGYIVSSAFNFAQKPDSILVTLPSGKRQAAQLVATDRSRLLVLLKVEAEEPLTPAQPAPQNEVRVGQWAISVGRTFEAERPNASVGVISAKGRIWGKALQTDAKISPNNYGGPLVDIRGRVLGVLVPMSPQETEEVAGVEWYDSGIGFAVPLETVLQNLPRLKEGQDLQTGLLGVSFKVNDLNAKVADIAVAAPTGPAYKAGFRKGDKIIEVAGQSVERHAQLKHAMGPLYAGETVRIVALRGDERIDREVTLAEKIEPYVTPFLGILPMRPVGKSAEGEPAGVTIRYVYPDSPAARAGLQTGDRVQTVGGIKVSDAVEMREQLQPLAPGESLAIEALRGDQTLLVNAVLTTLPEAVPGELPSAYDSAALATAGGEKPATGLVPIKLPEFANECLALVPDDFRADVPHGLVIWLHAPGGSKDDELVALWKPLCEKYDFILLAPKSGDPIRWQPTELGFVRRAADAVAKTYSIDPTRIAVHGHQAGATMAYLFGVTNVELVRAVAAVDAPLPRLSQFPQPDPVNRQAFYTTLATNSEQAALVEAGIERLRQLKYPVIVQEIGEQARYLTAEELEGLARWIDSLDRI